MKRRELSRFGENVEARIAAPFRVRYDAAVPPSATATTESTSATTVPPPSAQPRTTQPRTSPQPRVGGPVNTHFLLRRLHSLTGIVPVGVFVIFHLFTNAQMVVPSNFQHEVEFIHSLPAVIFTEVFGLWLPIAFHSILGVYYMFSGRHNVQSYRYGGNLRYSLQRWTAWIALVFIFLHVATLRWGWNIFGWYTPFYTDAVGLVNGEAVVLARDATGEPLGLTATSLAIAFQGGPQGSLLAAGLVLSLYLVGIAAVIYHWSNGLWTAAITWGITTSVASMRRWGYVCAGMAAALTLFSAAAIYGSLTYVPDAAHLDAWKAVADLETPPAEAQPDAGENAD